MWSVIYSVCLYLSAKDVRCNVFSLSVPVGKKTWNLVCSVCLYLPAKDEIIIMYSMCLFLSAKDVVSMNVI